MIRYQVDVEDYRSKRIEDLVDEWLRIRGIAMGYDRGRALAAAIEVGLLAITEGAYQYLASEAAVAADEARREWNSGPAQEDEQP